ncbi:MAG TPA: 6-pyruvoyl-tetrahydropterin synthase-related protein [Acidimicrobiia bacterium]|nr:6-pyruvoyl-tetrahydropterin synthase-related protein [Acidimicrobiia bacterium]
MVATRPAPADAPGSQLEAAAPLSARSTRPWWERLETWTGVAIVVACCVFVLFRLQPDLLLRNTTPSGGDTGAHVWWPAYLRDHLLPQWRIAGWAPDWFAGFPAGQFYFPFPALLIVALDTILPYNIAFKLVTALGSIALPAAAYAFGRGLRAPRPAPALFAVGATIFLFFKGAPGSDAEATRVAGNQHIMGGNLPSTFAGEFSFVLALALALCFLGALAFSLDHRRRMWLPAVLFAATVMSHLVVGMFAVVGAVVVWLARRPVRNFPAVAAIGGVGALLTAVWTLPLLTTLGYTSDMGYEAIGSGTSSHFLGEVGLYMFPWYPAYVLWVVPLVVAALVAGVIFRRRVTIELAALTAVMGLAFAFWEQLTDLAHSTPVWNLRLLPFWYLGLVLLAMLGAAELIRGAGELVARRVDPLPEPSVPAPSVATATAGAAPVEEDTEPAPGDEPRSEGDRQRERSLVRALTISVLAVIVASVAIWRVYVTTDFITFWAKWNYSGYEHTGSESDTKVYPEFNSLVSAVQKLPPGRALWEGGSPLGTYGTPLALMLLPYFTDGRIASMEGLYYESSATTPYHFLSVSTLSAPGNASNPQRNLPYRSITEFDVGVHYMQKLGVRYYLAFSDQAKEQADRSSLLVPVATTPDVDGQAPKGWTIYEVRDAPVVEALREQPVVVPGVSTRDWQDEVGVPWWDAPTRTPADARDVSLLDRPLVADGPSNWARARPPGSSRADAPDPKLPAAGALPAQQLPPVEVSRVRTDDHSVSFHVSRTGGPVLVKTSYFPNWTASGARGPWRATPNFMVVVPTSRDVRLEYSTTTAEYLGRAATVVGLLGVAGLAVWPWWQRRRRRDRIERAGGAAVDAGYPASE